MKELLSESGLAKLNPKWASGKGGLGLRKAIITILQVLIALVAPGVPWGVSHQAPAVGEQLLLGARQAAALRIAATWLRQDGKASKPERPGRNRRVPSAVLTVVLLQQLYSSEQHGSVLRVFDVQLVQVLFFQQLERVQVLVAVEQESGHVLLRNRKCEV